MKNLFLILAFVLLLFSHDNGLAQTTKPSNSSTQKAVLARLPGDILNTELQLLGGKTLKLSDYSGKVILINLFATWCPPCRLESPDLAKLHREFKNRGLVVIELTPEDPEDSQKYVSLWIETFRLPYPVGWITREAATTLFQDSEALPQAYLIARDGQIVKRFIGYNRTKTLTQMRAAILKSLAPTKSRQ